MTIKEIATIAGVSIATVSRVINNKEGVKPSVRDKVQKIIIDTDYQPNLVARSLVKQKSNVIGIMIPKFHGYYAQRVESIIEICNKNGYSVMMGSGIGKYSGEVEMLKMLFEKQVEGIIYFAAKFTPEKIEELNKINKKIPIVLVDQKNDILNFPYVIPDNYSGAKQAMQHLIDNGHKNIAFIDSPNYDLEAKKRYQAYVDSLKENNLKLKNEYFSSGFYSINSGYSAMENILNNSKDIPTAVFSANDYMAIGAINKINEIGLNVPDDISVVGYDDIEISKYFIPALTTIKEDQVLIGKTSAKLLIDLIKQNHNIKKEITIKQELVIRDSVIKLK